MEKKPTTSNRATVLFILAKLGLTLNLNSNIYLIGDILAVDAERVKKPRLPKKRFLKKTMKNKGRR